MAYVYRHIRLDTQKPFYIGVGNSDDELYKRAFEKCKGRRCKEWYDVIHKTEYDVDILMDSIPLEIAYKKETEFIVLYGRSDLNTGTLVNKTDGGPGNVNGITRETRLKMAAKLRGRPQPEWQRKILSNAAKGKTHPWQHRAVLQFDISGTFLEEFRSITDAVNKLGLQQGNIVKVLTGKRRHTGGFIFCYKQNNIESVKQEIKSICENRDKNKEYIIGKNGTRKLKNVLTGVIYDTIKDASISEGIPKGTIGCWMSKGDNRRFKYVYNGDI